MGPGGHAAVAVRTTAIYVHIGIWSTIGLPPIVSLGLNEGPPTAFQT